MTDYSALAEQAARDRQSANARFQEARADSETSALRELVFTAASYGVTRLLLEPSDQGSYMTVSEIEPEVDGEAEDIIGDSGSYDMSDYHQADWLAVAGVTADEVGFRDEQIRKASIDIKVAAEALLAVEPSWTFVGHWENDRIVIEYVLPGEVQDAREDAGFWEQGLFAASASGATQDEALAKVRAEYETDEEG